MDALERAINRLLLAACILGIVYYACCTWDSYMQILLLGLVAVGAADGC